ncbi:MAG: MFS transporter [Candidatus Taylorbacteria bacterium]|nr:MFS transporter [Candidatus Taylorbacteria bacterium]
MKTRKNIWLWASYDFANSIISIIFFLYFSQWIVIEKGFTDLSYNLTYTYATILLLFVVPVVGFLMDTRMRRISGLRVTTIFTTVAYILCAWFGIYGNPAVSLALFALGMFFYMLTFTFYTPLINDISHEHERGRVSGYGVCLNYIGQFAGLLFALPFANGTWSIFGVSGRLETLIPAAILYVVLSLPMLIFFHEPKREVFPDAKKLKEHARSIWNSTVELFRYKPVLLFFLTYFLFNDTVLTAANNFPIFVEQVWGVSDTLKSAILAGIVVTSALGGIIGGRIGDRFGHKKTLTVILYGWIFILPSIGYAPTFSLFVVCATLMGFWFGASWAVSRAVMSYLTPSGMHNLTFGYFGLVERTSSLIGPLVWGYTVTSLVSVGSVRYQIATLVITVFVVISVFVFKKVRGDK